jgi:MFS family permease
MKTNLHLKTCDDGKALNSTYIKRYELIMVIQSKSIHNFFAQKGFTAGFIAVINTYSWFFPLYILFEGTLNNIISINEYSTFQFITGVHYLAAIISAFAGVFLVNKVTNRDQVLISWMLMGTAVSLSLGFMPIINSHLYLYVVSFLLGVSLGLGFPLCLAYFADYNVENTGKRAGITFFISGFGILIAGLATTLLPFVISITIFAIWRMMGCVLFTLMRPNERKEIGSNVTYKFILNQRSFILYFIPWIMYCIINFFEASLLKGFFGPDFSYFVPVAEFGIGGVVALASGYLADIIGRKIVIAVGYVMLGIGYAFLGLFPSNMLSWYLYVIVDGISGGIFALTFFMVIWGELAQEKSKAKYYLLGEMPYLVFGYLGIIVKPYIEIIPVSSAFSLAALFLFLAVLPLMYAPETLPETDIRRRELRRYIEKAKKIRGSTNKE